MTKKIGSETSKPRPLRVLMVEDLEDDALLIIRALKRGGYDPEVERVETAGAMQKALQEKPWDVILCDYQLPQFNGLAALALLEGTGKDIPFIIVSGAIGEEIAVECMRLGARDYIMKSNLPRLTSAIERELKERESRRHLERVKESLRESEERYRTAIEHSNDGVAIMEGTRHLFVNQRYARIFGYNNPEEIIGQPLDLVIHPDDKNKVLEITRLRQQGASVLSNYEIKGLRKDGTAVFIEVSATITVYHGKAVSLANLRDITERKLAEAERERLMAAIEQAGEVIFITDPKGTIQYVNPAFETVTGYSRLEILGQNPRFLKSGKQDQAFYRHLWETISAGRTWKGRMINKRKDGKLYTVEATISPVLDGAGRIVNYVAVKRDISEYLQLTDQFQQAQKMESVGRLAGGVAHDFNNHLTVIIGNAQLALMDLDQGSPLWEKITEIHQAGSKAALLTRQLLAFSRKQVLHSEVVNLNEVVSETKKMLGRLIGEDIDLKTVLAPDLGNVEVDAGQMEQIIINLAVNARDAMPRGGRLTIATDNTELDQEEASSQFPVTPGLYVRLSVSDTGEGMSPEVQTHIFEPFYTTKIEGKGTGLGLSTVYGIVKQSRGYIMVESAVGQGTTVQIYLPRITKEVDKGNEKKRTRGLAGGSETILVVDDDEPLLDLAVKALTRYGYKVLKARDGQEALAMVQEFTGPVHLLLTDMIMPGMNGKELAERLGGLLPGIKVLFMSGYTDEPSANLFLLDKGFIFIQKPFTIEALVRKVGAVLGNK